MRTIIACLLTLILAACSSGDNGGGTTPPGEKKSCTLPAGGLLEHGKTVALFKEAKVVAPAKCETEVRTCNDGVLSGTFTNAACVVDQGDQEPVTHEKPFRIDDKDLKIGGIKTMGELSLWRSGPPDGFSPKPPTPPVCSTVPVNGSTCAKGAAACSSADGQTWYKCETKVTYKVFGWIYEQIGRDYKAAEGVTTDIFWFTGCMVGVCTPMAGPVKTDKYGYFEILTGTLLDQVRINGLDVGLYAFCINKKPSAGGGISGLSAYVDKAFPDAFAHQKRIKPDSCLQ